MEIKIEDLTTMDLQGEGAFDNVMTAMQTRLDREFTKNRIKGPEYAKVYLGTYEASLLNTIQFILGRQEADKKAELLVQQTITEKDQLLTAEVSRKQIVQQTITEKDKLLTAKIGRDHVAAQILQTEKQTEKLNHDIDLVDVQIEVGKKDVIKRTSEIALLDQDLLLQKELFKKAVFETQLTEVMVDNARKEGLQIVATTLGIEAGTKLKEAELPILVQKLESEKAQTKILSQTHLKLVEETDLVKAQTQSEKNKKLLLDQQILLMKKEIDKMTHEINLMAAQVQKMIKEGQLVDAQVKKINSEIPLVAAQITKVKNEGLLITGQIKKIDAEIPLVAAQVGKMAAEGALLNQKKISEDGQTKSISTGVIGAQRTLLNKQEKGFDRDSEQKAAKIYADVLTTQLVATDGVNVTGAGFGDSSSKQASSKLLAGIGK